VLIDPQVRHRRGGLIQHRVRRGGERAMRDRPRHSRVPGRPGRRDPPPGERLATAAPLIAFPAALDPPHPHRITSPAHVPRPGQHDLIHPPGSRPAVRARHRSQMTADRPDLQRAVRARLRTGDLQALHAEQRRRRTLEHDARGFLLTLKSLARPKIVRTAGSLITAVPGTRHAR
jgi:hypothetical protein